MQKLKSVLLIDDDNAANFIHRIVIEETELVEDVGAFESPRAALKYLEDLQSVSPFPEIIFLDINMPLMDGWEFLDYCEKHIPTLTDSCMICILSSSIIGKDIIRADQHPMVSEYVAKPLTGAKVKSAYQLYFNLIGVKQKSK